MEEFNAFEEGIRRAPVMDDNAAEEEGILPPLAESVPFRIGEVCFGFKIFESLFTSIRRGLRRGDPS